MTSPSRSRAPMEDFDVIYRREHGFVWRVLRYHGVTSEAIEDAVQDVFMVVHRRWPGAAEEQRSMRSWLFGIARRVAATRRRSVGRHERKLAAIPEPTPTACLEQQAADREVLRRLEALLQQLDHKLAVVFMLTEIEGLTAPEIARELGENVNTIYWRQRTARAQINRAMAEQE